MTTAVVVLVIVVLAIAFLTWLFWDEIGFSGTEVIYEDDQPVEVYVTEEVVYEDDGVVIVERDYDD